MMIIGIRCLAFFGIVIYFILDYIDGRRVRDEREELIRLKSLELTHKFISTTLSFLALAYVLWPGLTVQLVILIMVAVALYGEIAAKFFYRRQL